MGRVLKDGAVFASPESLEGILNAASCKNPRTAHSLVGVARWIVNFVPNLVTLLQPFTALTRNVPFAWLEDVHGPALDALKAAMRNHVGNAFVDWNDRCFIIYTNASKLGCGAVLLQHGLDGTMRIIEIDSYSFNKTQRKWSAIEREGFGIVRALGQFCRFVLGADDLEVRTDCRPLMFILRNHHDTSNGRIQRWVISLETFNATFVHVPTEKNELAGVPFANRAPCCAFSFHVIGYRR